jgi:hypothetical protein
MKGLVGLKKMVLLTQARQLANRRVEHGPGKLNRPAKNRDKDHRGAHCPLFDVILHITPADQGNPETATGDDLISSGRAAAPNRNRERKTRRPCFPRESHLQSDARLQ